MHEAHWGLRESPFRAGFEARFFFDSPTHVEALSRLKFLCENRRRLGLLLGERGAGKSFVCEMLAKDLRRQATAVAQVNLLGLESRDLLWTLAAQLGGNPQDDAALFTLWRIVADRLAEQRCQQAATVLLLDDADLASPDVLAAVQRIIQLDPWSEARLTIVLAAEADRVGQIGASLLDLAELRIELEPWSAAETAEYLAAELATAGGESTLFETNAATKLHALSQGVPRRVSQLAGLALLAGAGQGLSQVDESTVEAVYHELSAQSVATQEFSLASD